MDQVFSLPNPRTLGSTLPGMAPRLGRYFLAAALALAGLVSAIPVAQADTSGQIVDVTPAMKTLDASKGERQTVFSTTFTAGAAGEVRFVGSELVLGNPSTRIFIGVTVTCTGPKKFSDSMETGRNVWQGDGTIVIPVGMVITTKAAGEHTCETNVFMCDPGECGSSEASGTIPVVSKASGQKSYSLLAISEPLPDWADDALVPGAKDVLAARGSTFASTSTFDVTNSAGPVQLGAILSITNCIEPAYPDVCSKAPTTAIQGKAKLSLSLTAKQVSTVRGTKCATAKATKKSGARGYTITWQQHHAVFAVAIPTFTLSTKSGCGSSIQVTVKVKAKSGNDLAIEGGTKAIPTSVAYVIPAS